ncbi:ergothioneine biosynthesis glutamate--cysteine ligase EgtA [Streptomonospora nanhaiensis]|uniref:Glutamate--cysteine ligase EgtA n=1 Tax=Streptomonospora nanhaiensis TaxID=1323731 RepID=A0A853BLD0_9ACTN|nr:ergothioneine biosynthesis glutamate--cysteine ligase EgtA [Streptomonospora nanhaiensis]MBV2365606.1 ergothioneine biosynthesis glutamate--cysteine ligase EgtA [Streptomonospora nanhaiensis]NYI95504.1 glutamate--cysteine ligase [Streptomonospora nanhaiensis]
MSYLTESDVHDYINGVCFKTGPPGRVGAEAEWLVTDPARPGAPVPIRTVSTAVAQAGPPPGGSAVTFEPGGQLELSSPPLPGPGAAYAALAADTDHIARHLSAAGLRLVGVGLDPRRPPVRQLAQPRYAAMERYFDSAGCATGRLMMCSTASLQVCLDIGADAADAARRWRLAHRLGPLLVAAFANSPVHRGRATGWRSSRWAVWEGIDPSRTRAPGRGDPVAAWTAYALRARLMTIRADHGPWEVDPGLAFGDWLACRHRRRPTREDLAYHLSTLFPPVRPRGWLELRMIDALPARWLAVPIAVAAALLDDPAAADTAAEATERLGGGAGLWRRAAALALADPELAACARTCFAAASAALERMDEAGLAGAVEDYRERFVERGRCPADLHHLAPAA